MVLSVGDYDPDEPEGSKKSGSQYMSRKDLRWIVIIIFALLIAGTPVWMGMRDQRNKQVCKTNIRAIHAAMFLYAAENDDRLPPLYHVGDNGAPMLFDDKPIVWASLLVPYMTKRAGFVCPAAEDSEKMSAYADDGDKRADIELTYGMYLPMSSQPHLLLDSPKTTALIAETSNGGAMGTFNPLPFRDLTGKIVPFDAFMIGYDDSNTEFSEETNWVTRLALRETTDGESLKEAKPRHGAGIHVMYVDGHMRLIFGKDAEVKNLYPNLTGLWQNY